MKIFVLYNNKSIKIIRKYKKFKQENNHKN